MVQACQVLTGLCDVGCPRPPTQTWQLLPRLSGRGRPHYLAQAWQLMPRLREDGGALVPHKPVSCWRL